MYTLKLNNALHLLSMAVVSESKDLDVCAALRILSLVVNIVSKLSKRSVIDSDNLVVSLVGKPSQAIEANTSLIPSPPNQAH